MKSFFLKITFATIILAIAGGFLFGFFFPEAFSPIFPVLLLFGFLFALGSYGLQFSKINDNFSKFSRIHMLVTLVRLFVYSAIVVGYLILSGSNIATFVVVIAVLYIVFTFLETKELSKQSLGKPN